jgi:DDE superfamily endonuclease/Helix-turn-helix of DDE superfamily endonuclease
MKAITGLDRQQLVEVAARVHAVLGPLWTGGRPPAAGLYRSVVMVVFLLRQNATQQVVAELFGVSQSTVSRRWDLLRPVIAAALAEAVPAPAEIAGTSTVLVDGTLVPTWDWRHRSDLFNAKRGDHGMNLQVAAIRGGRLVAVGDPVPGAWHDTHALAECGLPEQLTGLQLCGDLGYLGTGMITGRRKPPGQEHTAAQLKANQTIASFRSHNEHVIGHLKNWKILSHRYRPPLEKLSEAVRAIVALQLFRTHYEPTYE